jgi:hypothetical protein
MEKKNVQSNVQSNLPQCFPNAFAGQIVPQNQIVPQKASLLRHTVLYKAFFTRDWISSLQRKKTIS